MAFAAKTFPTDVKVSAFVDGLDNARRREESGRLLEMMQRLSGEPAKMWGPSIIGFGSYDYTYASGHSGTSMRIGFSPRKAAMTVYIMPGYDNKAALLEQTGAAFDRQIMPLHQGPQQGRRRRAGRHHRPDAEGNGAALSLSAPAIRPVNLPAPLVRFDRTRSGRSRQALHI